MGLKNVAMNILIIYIINNVLFFIYKIERIKSTKKQYYQNNIKQRKNNINNSSPIGVTLIACLFCFNKKIAYKKSERRELF